ncbi:hypothetical protein [Haliea sp. E17]|uniref:hypothetical protein n=1 Tax=Haliea sp. E17 TaxID=3401576 RepID=UPI003AAE7181
MKNFSLAVSKFIRRHIPVVLSGVAALLSTISYADQYSLEYGVEAGYEYNDNVRLTPDNEVSISGGQLTIPATFATEDERLKTSLQGELKFSKYDVEEYDSDDQFLRGDMEYKFERSEFNGYAGYTRDSTRSSEFLDTGVVGLEAVRREMATVGASGSHFFTEKNGLTAGIDYRDVQYDSDFFQDFDFVSGYAGWINQWTERTRLRLQGFASRYENDGDITVSTDGAGLQAGFDSDLSERTTTTLLIGWVSSSTDYSTNLPIAPPDDSDDDSLYLRATVNYRGERHFFRGQIKSEPSPSSNGTMVEENLLGLVYRYRVTERSNFESELTVGQRGALDDRIKNDRDFARLSLGLDYRITEAWYVSGRYQFSYQDRDLDPDSADSNAVYLSLVFRPQKSVWSR